MANYDVIGKVELAQKHLGEGAEGVPRQTKIGLDLKARDGDGELNNKRVISEDLAWKTRLGFRHESGEEFFFEGLGAQKDAEGNTKLFKPRPAVVAEFGKDSRAGKSIPEGGYTLDGPGISALEDSNGFRLLQNFKKLPEGQYTAFGSIKGVEARFPKGNTFRVGKAKPRRHAPAKKVATRKK